MKDNATQGYGKPERAPFKARDTLHESAVNRLRLFVGILVVVWLISLGCIVCRIYVGAI